MEYKVSQGFMNNREFFEGVWALLIDKDNNPKWSHKSLSEVSSKEVEEYFNRPEELDLNILTDFSKAIKG